MFSSASISFVVGVSFSFDFVQIIWDTQSTIAWISFPIFGVWVFSNGCRWLLIVSQPSCGYFPLDRNHGCWALAVHDLILQISTHLFWCFDAVFVFSRLTAYDGYFSLIFISDLFGLLIHNRGMATNFFWCFDAVYFVRSTEFFFDVCFEFFRTFSLGEFPKV